MKTALAFALLALPLWAMGQSPLGPVPEFRAAAFNAAAVEQDDQWRAEAGELPLYGRSLALGAGSAAGQWTQEGNERICRMAIASPGALAMELFLENVAVPAGASMRITAADGTELQAPFNLDLPEGVNEYATPLVAGDHWTLEYRQPAAAGQGRFDVASVGHAYRDVGFLADREGNCHVNVACEPEADGWEGPIRATVRISVVVPQGTGWCTGTLVNNVRADCAPYILSAFHCGRESTTANFNQYKFYFNFQYATCTGGAYSTAQYITGAQLKAYSNDYNPLYQGLGGSDFMLLRTNVDIPEAYAPYWAGWDATNLSTVSADGVCIHHPTGAPKRISSYTQTLTTGHPMASSGLMSHYKVTWAQTAHGWGLTEQGSSGAGLFKQIDGTGPVLIGTCTGNSSGMSCSNHSGLAYFGKMSYHWTNNPNAAALKLKAWLDPDNTGTLVLAGSDAPCASAAGTGGTDRAGLPKPYPNPATNEIRLALDGTDQRYCLTDATGRVLLTGSAHAPAATLDVSTLKNGTYFIQLLDQGRATRTVPVVILR